MKIIGWTITIAALLTFFSLPFIKEEILDDFSFQSKTSVGRYYPDQNYIVSFCPHSPEQCQKPSWIDDQIKAKYRVVYLYQIFHKERQSLAVKLIQQWNRNSFIPVYCKQLIKKIYSKEDVNENNLQQINAFRTDVNLNFSKPQQFQVQIALLCLIHFLYKYFKDFLGAFKEEETKNKQN